MRALNLLLPGVSGKGEPEPEEREESPLGFYTFLGILFAGCCFLWGR